MQTANKPQAAGLARKGFLGAALGSVLLACGCQTATGTGALAGGALGTGIGALAGGRHGALAGGLIGAGVGGLTGAAVDAKHEKQAEQAAVAQSQQEMMDIANLAQSHTADAIIINKVRTSNTVYHLTADQINWLKAYQVSDAVIVEMQATAARPQRVYAPTRVVVVEEPPPPPPPAVGFGVMIRR
jgi:hypothetical protein